MTSLRLHTEMVTSSMEEIRMEVASVLRDLDAAEGGQDWADATGKQF